MGNKGACSIRFKYKDSTMTFAAAHLESGRGEGHDAARRNMLETIIKNSYINERGTNMSWYAWQSHDIKVIFGDLNFRPTLALDEEQCHRLVEQDDIQSLQYYDEFIQFMNQPKHKKGLLRHYKEGTITYGPSYKYIIKTNEYDPKRMPAYTDRILFESIHDTP